MIDVVVIGAGLSGLQACRQLDLAGVSYQLFEARDRIGGRTLTEELDGRSIDLGAQWIGHSHHRMLSLCHEFGISVYKQFEQGSHRYTVAGKTARSLLGLPRLGIRDSVNTAIVISKLMYDVRRFATNPPTNYDGISVEEWLDFAKAGPAAKSIVEIFCHTIFAAEPHELSYFFFLRYLHLGGGLRNLAEVRRGAQQFRIEGGAQQIAEKLSASLAGKILLDTPVDKISREKDTIVVRSGDKETPCRQVIIAIPPVLVPNIDFGSELAPLENKVWSELKMGRAIKCHVSYDQPFWRTNKVSGFFAGRGSTIRLAFDSSDVKRGKFGMVAFLLGDAADGWFEIDESKRTDIIDNELRNLFGPAENASVVAYKDFGWMDEPWTKGCYTTVFGPNMLTRMDDYFALRSGPIHFAGTEVAHEAPGYMEGAIEAGGRIAQHVASRL